MTEPHADLKRQVRELIARLDPQPTCPATHPLGPCFGQVGHGAIHWVWVPHERKGEDGHMRLIWTEDVAETSPDRNEHD